MLTNKIKDKTNTGNIANETKSTNGICMTYRNNKSTFRDYVDELFAGLIWLG